MNRETLDTILADHKTWLEQKGQGQRAEAEAAKEEAFPASAHYDGQLAADFRPAPSRWETIKQRVGALFSREETPAPEPEPATPSAPSPAPQAGRDSAVGQHLAPAQPTPTREDAQAARAQIQAHPEETRAAIAQIADPVDRAKAGRLLAIVEQDAAARQRTSERAAAAQLDR